MREFHFALTGICVERCPWDNCLAEIIAAGALFVLSIDDTEYRRAANHSLGYVKSIFVFRKKNKQYFGSSFGVLLSVFKFADECFIVKIKNSCVVRLFYVLRTNSLGIVAFYILYFSFRY